MRSCRNFADQLLAEIDRKRSCVVVGLDPVISHLPEQLLNRAVSRYGYGFRAFASAVTEFNVGIIDAVHDIAIAVKPQVAFYEALGIPGLIALQKTISYAQKANLLVIQDAKRGDIGTSAEAYAVAHIGRIEIENRPVRKIFGADAVTVNPFLGSDSIRPFISRAESQGKGVFVLVKTSNPSSIEIQDLKVEHLAGHDRLYDVLADLVTTWGTSSIGERGYSSVGAVVGATFPEQARKLRRRMRNTIFLVPGYGAQGGKGEDVAACFNEDGYGAIVNSSRGIIYAFKSGGKETEFGKAARTATIRMREDLLAALK